MTGLVDANQTGVYKISMFQNAKKIGLPESFVELRHQATHDELPALLVLRQAATRSLQWLWQAYWRSIDIKSGTLDNDGLGDADDLAKLKEQFRDRLRSYLKVEMDVMKKGITPPSTDRVVTVSQQCAELSNGSFAAIRVLVHVLLEPGFIIPTEQT